MPEGRGALVRALVAEFAGTFLIVLFGCGSVCSSLSGAYAGIWQVAAVWGLGVSLAILSTADASGAHLNPAVTLAFLLVRPSAHGMTPTKALLYTVAQLLGGVAGGAVNLAVHGTTIAAFERAHGIVRGSPESVLSAAAFGEYFPNPSLLELSGGPYRAEDVDAFGAMGVEAWGSAVLCFVIFGLTHSRNKALGSGERVGVPLMIGATVAVLLALYAPITQAGWNPARDLGPRLVAAMAGWGAVAIPGPNHGCWAYVVGPCVGAPVGAFLAEVGLWGTWYERLDGPSEKPAAHARPMSELGVDADAHTDGVHVELAAGARTAAAADDGSPPSSPAVLPAPRSRAEPLKPIVLFTTDKPNGKKVSIVLEELGLPYRVLSISLEAGEQHSAAFGRYSPNHKIPAILDPNHTDARTGQPLSLFESGAILLYLAKQYGGGALTGGPRPADQYACLAWLFFQVSGLGPIPGQVHHFVERAGMADLPPSAEPLPVPTVETTAAFAYALVRFDRETRRLYSVLNGRLGETGAYVAGEHFSVADIALWCWVWRAWKHKVDLAAFPHVRTWFERIGRRPAVKRGLLVPTEEQKRRPRTEPAPELSYSNQP